MTHEAFLAFLIFAFATSITPGPNNILLMTSGVNHGFRATLPHMCGVAAGFVLLLLGTGLGLSEVFSRYPAVYGVMKWLGASYFVYFAWKLASAPTQTMTAESRAGGAWRFHDAVAFQCVNPKGWIMAVGAFSSYVPATSSPVLVSTMALVFALIAAPCFMVWVLFGSRLRRYLEQGIRRRIFNLGMAGLLLTSLIPLFTTPN